MLRALLLFALVFSFSTKATQWVPFNIDNGHITFDIKMDGVSTTAMLDSGAEVHMIDASFAEQHGQNLVKAGKMNIIGANGTSEVQVYNNVPVNLFGVDLEFNKVPSGNLSSSASSSNV